VTQPGAGRALRELGLPAHQIEALSIERMRAAATVELPPSPADTVALRMAYAAGDPSLLGEIVVDAVAVHDAVQSMREGLCVICDTRMVLAGIRRDVEAAGAATMCALDVHGQAAEGSTDPAWLQDATRAAASTAAARAMVRLATTEAPCAAIVVGAAPTALLAVLDLLGDGMPRPGAVIATCPGLVAAAEAKLLLLRSRERLGVGVIAVTGTRGGSAVAAAAVNALARMALTD
jgi:precorrin-8X/cobalt-precorrin-8 methylmutase